jgi:NAD(P)-dependent dehydrogenase (short-subunit alcohol dehydrogenase family)
MMAQARFDGDVAVVTGAGRGIGRAVALQLGEEGCDVICVDIDEASAEETAARIEDDGGSARAIACDLTDEGQVKALADEAAGLTILVNNAGAWRYASLLEGDVAEWDFVFDANAKSVWLAIRSLAPIMMAAKYGRIVNVSSTAAFRPKTDLFHYAAAKAAVVSLTRTAAEELAPHGILVNGVAPGPTATEQVKARYDLATRGKDLPIGRVGEPADLAEVIVFLTSRANRFMMGETVLVNGGVVIR